MFEPRYSRVLPILRKHGHDESPRTWASGPYWVSQCTSHAAAVAARLWSFLVTITVRTMLLTLGTLASVNRADFTNSRLKSVYVINVFFSVSYHKKATTRDVLENAINDFRSHCGVPYRKVHCTLGRGFGCLPTCDMLDEYSYFCCSSLAAKAAACEQYGHSSGEAHHAHGVAVIGRSFAFVPQSLQLMPTYTQVKQLVSIRNDFRNLTTRTKQKSTLSASSDARTDVVPSVNSIVRTVIVTRKLQSLAATAAACEVHWETQYGPLAHVRGDSSWPCFRNIGSTREYLGSNNSQSALGQYSVHLSAPFLVTVGAIWAVSRDCSDCGTKANSPNNGDS